MNSVPNISGNPFPCEHHGLAVIRRRRGSLMVEMVVCTVLLSVVAAILAPAIHGVKQQRIANRFETLALIELNNVAAKLQASETEAAAEIVISTWFASRYPDAKLTVEPLDSDDFLAGKKITVSRMVFDGQVTLSRSLTTWVIRGAAE